jgi:hypothetical protein
MFLEGELAKLHKPTPKKGITIFLILFTQICEDTSEKELVIREVVQSKPRVCLKQLIFS